MLSFTETKPGLFPDQEEKDQFKEILRTNVVDVTFIKKDGTERKLKCTLNENIVPAKVVDESANTVVRSVNNDAQAVYDVESKGWRSFRWDSVVAIEYGDLVK